MVKRTPKVGSWIESTRVSVSARRQVGDASCERLHDLLNRSRLRRCAGREADAVVGGLLLGLRLPVAGTAAHDALPPTAGRDCLVEALDEPSLAGNGKRGLI